MRNKKISHISCRAVCCLLILCLLSGLLPVMALEEITSVDIMDVTEPTAGASPTFQVSAPSDGFYQVSEVFWTNSNGSSMSSFDLFRSGESYWIHITVVPYSDCVFKADESGNALVSATVNGHSAQVQGTETEVTVSYSFTASQSTPSATEISRVSVSGLMVPIAGATPDTTANAGNSSYSVDSIRWSHISRESGAATDMSGTFRAGEKYRVTVTLRAASGYVFSGAVTASFNGSVNISCHTPSGKTPGEYIYFTQEYTLAQGSTITHADITGLMVPVKGSMPDYTANVSSAAPYTINEISWKKWKTSQSEDSSVAIGTREVFQLGYCYQVSITLKAKSNHSFATDAQGRPQVTGTVNGQESLPGAAVAGKDSSQYVRICFNYALDANGIDAVTVIDVIDPVAGSRPNALADVPENSLYSVLSVDWEYYDSEQPPAQFVSMNPYAIFTAGMHYRVSILLKAASDAQFTLNEDGAPAVAATVNGNEATVSVSPNGHPAESYILVTYGYPMLQEDIHQVDVAGITEPAVGKKPDYQVDISEDALFTVDKVTWEYLDMEQTPAEYVKLDPNATFEANRDYRVVLLLKATEGGRFFINDFDELQVTATVNGEPTIPASPVENKHPAEYVSISYDFSLSSNARLIKRVSLHDLEIPRLGESPDFQVSTEALCKYTVHEVTWERLVNRNSSSAAETLDEGDIFQEGKYYRVRIILKADDGYVFHTNQVGMPQLTATLNSGAGMSANKVLGMDAKQYICVQMTYGIYTVIDGGSGQWTPGDGDLRFRFSGDCDQLTAVRVNGAALESSFYTVSEGSTVILLHQDFLNTLADGIYQIEAIYTDGIAATEFEVVGGLGKSDGQEKKLSVWVWLLPVIIVLLCGMLVGVILLKRKAENKVYDEEEEFEEYEEEDE